MESVRMFIVIGILTFASKLELGEGFRKDRYNFVRVVVPKLVQEGETALLHCQYDVDRDRLYSMRWYKGSKEFYRFTPNESPSIRVFNEGFSGNVDLSLSTSSDVALVHVNLNITDVYTCEAIKDFPDYTSSTSAGNMTVVSRLYYKPATTTTRKSVSIGDTLAIETRFYNSSTEISDWEDNSSASSSTLSDISCIIACSAITNLIISYWKTF